MFLLRAGGLWPRLGKQSTFSRGGEAQIPPWCPWGWLLATTIPVWSSVVNGRTVFRASALQTILPENPTKESEKACWPPVKYHYSDHFFTDLVRWWGVRASPKGLSLLATSVRPRGGGAAGEKGVSEKAKDSSSSLLPTPTSLFCLHSLN